MAVLSRAANANGFHPPDKLNQSNEDCLAPVPDHDLTGSFSESAYGSRTFSPLPRPQLDPRVAKLSTPKECEIFARNALARDRADLAMEAKHWAIKLNAKAYGNQTGAELECLEAVYAYEQVLLAANGKPSKASRTWQLIKRQGILATVEREIERDDENSGYNALAAIGLEKYSFEAVILRYPNLFSGPAVSKAEQRKAQHTAGDEA